MPKVVKEIEDVFKAFGMPLMEEDSEEEEKEGESNG